MKLRNVLIVLFAVLMVFAFASCKNEPKNEPKPTPQPKGDIYQIEVTEGVDKDYYNRDKIKLVWNVPIAEGDTISLKYRSERAVYQWDLRNDSHKWVYETDKNGFVDPVLGEDGWYTLEYTFGKTIAGAAGASTALGIYFRGNFVTTDIFEIKDILLNGEELEVEQSNITSQAKLNDPAEDFDWSVKNYAVLFATGKPGAVDKTPIAEKVVAGGLVTGAPISKEGYTLTIYTDEAHTAIFDPTQPINEEKIFYYEYVGKPQTVTFVTNTEATIDPATVPYGDTLLAAHTYDEAGNYALDGEGAKVIVNLVPANPSKEGFAFAAWCSDEGLTTDFDFATPITGATTLYAKYGTPRTVTFDAQNGELEHATAVVADGYPVAMPAEAPTFGTKMFLGWFTDPECTTAYNFAAPVVDADLTLYGGWVAATDVTLMEGSTTLKTFKAALDVALAADNENLVVVDDRIGYVFAGWYSDAELTTAYDYSTVVIAPFTLYAKWVEAPLYKIVATGNAADDQYGKDKLAIVHSTADVDDQDVLSFRFRTTRDFKFFSIRRAGGGKKWIYQNSDAEHNYGFTSFETKEDGWTYVTYKFDKATAVDKADAGIPLADFDFEIHFGNRWNDPSGNSGIVAGDILEVQDWAINGVPMVIAAADVTSYAGATVTVVEGGSYAWTDPTVTFVTGEGSEIAPIVVEFNGKLELPADPVLAGKAFAGWFTDAEYEHPFNAATQLVADLTLYAKYADAVTVSFDGVELEDVVIAKGNTIAKPADPAKAENVFGGWYADALFETPFNFAAAIEADTTIYAKWVPSWTVTLNYNYGETPETKAVYVGKGEVMAAPASIARVGYFFGGWYNDQAGTEAHDWTAAVTANTTVYAKWNAPEEAYQFTSTVAESRWQFRWHEDTIELLNGKISAGDVFTLMLKFPEGNTLAENYWRLRVRNGEAHITENTSFSSTTKEGDWYLITAVVPEAINNGSGLYLQVYGADEANWPVGSVMIIKALAINGQEIEIDARDYGTASTRKGAYEKICPNGAVIAP